MAHAAEPDGDVGGVPGVRGLHRQEEEEAHDRGVLQQVRHPKPELERRGRGLGAARGSAADNTVGGEG